MTVEEMIEALKEYTSNTQVVVADWSEEYVPPNGNIFLYIDIEDRVVIDVGSSGLEEG